MKAVAYHAYGSPDVLHLEEVPAPVPGDTEVLVRVRAAAVNSWDWEYVQGTPLVNRIGGLRHPRHPILGADVAGTVEAVGKRVVRLRPGDAVYGDLSGCGWGGFAEYVCADEDALARKPVAVSYEEAAAVPQAGVLALQALRDVARLRPGERVLVNGAGGGAGTFAVALANLLGASVTGVDSAEKQDLMRSLGVERAMDYAQQDYTRTGERYDVIVDMQAYRRPCDYARALRPAGRFVAVGGSGATLLAVVAAAPVVRLTQGKRLALLLHRPKRADLEYLGALLDAGVLAPAIDRRFALADTPQAVRYFSEGHAQGKVVITV